MKNLHKKWMRISTAAHYADVSERTIRDWVKEGLRHARRTRKLILIKTSDLDDYLENFVIAQGDDDIIQEMINT